MTPLKQPGSICLFLVLAAGANLHAHASSPYSGLYAVYGAARSLGVDAKFDPLIQEEYLGSFRGSSVDELKAAGSSIGIDVVSLVGLGRASLLNAEDPLILQVSPLGTEGTYTHWLLFLGMNQQKAIVNDGSGETTEVPVEYLLSRWNGSALAVTLPEKSTWYTQGQFLSFLTMTALYLAAITTVYTLAARHSSRAFASVFSIAVLGTASAAIMYISQGNSAEAANARLGIDAAKGVFHPAEISIDEFAKQLRNKTSTVVDCRYRADFSADQIPGTVNIPIDVGLSEFVSTVRELEPDGEIVLFCQSSGCHFSDVMAAMFSSQGFRNVSVFRGGVNAWKESKNHAIPE